MVEKLETWNQFPELVDNLLNWDYNNLIHTMNIMDDKEVIDLLDFIADKGLNDEKTIKLFRDTLIHLLNRMENWLADMLNIFTHDNKKIDSLLTNPKEIIKSLNLTYNQLKLNWGNPKNTASNIRKVSGEVDKIVTLMNYLDNLWFSPLEIDEISPLKSELENALFKISQIEAMSYSDLWELWIQRWWKLAQRPDSTDVMIVDTKTNKVVLELLGDHIKHHQYTSIVSTNTDTIATSAWTTVKFWNVDDTKWKKIITWNSDDWNINTAMVELASMILKQWYYWKLEHIWNWYFKMDWGFVSFFDNKWNILSNKSRNKEFVDSFAYEHTVEKWKVVRKSRFSNLESLGNSMFWKE